MAREITYTVRGYWPFPTDMLRHDGSRAATETDQALIDRLSGDSAPDRAAFQNVDINLVGPWKPNAARWESFGWAIPADVEHQYYKRSAEKEKRRKALAASGLAKLTAEEKEALRLTGAAA